MKKLFSTIALLLAVNFLAVAGGVGWLFQSHHLDKQRIAAIKAVVFPPPAPPAPPATQPAGDDNKPAPLLALDDLLDRQTRSQGADKQLQAVQSAFDARMAQLDQRQQQIEDLSRLVDAAKAKNLRDRQRLDADRAQLEADKQEAQRLASDQGFQDTLELYNTMSPKQVKAIFMNDDDATVGRYLQAMEPRTAASIIKEFKSPAEMTRIQTVLDGIRSGGSPSPTTQEASQ
jgi:hypothetical protein